MYYIINKTVNLMMGGENVEINIKKALDEALDEVLDGENHGNVADYIPVLARVNPNYFSAAVKNSGEIYSSGDEVIFSIQSVSKVITLVMALEKLGEEVVFNHVGMENSPFAFNDIRTIGSKATNPFVNAGAITTVGLLYNLFKDNTTDEIINFMKDISGYDGIRIDEEVFESEMATCSMNRALAYYLKHLGLIDGDTESVLREYIKTCAITTSCSTLASIAEAIAMDGAEQISEGACSKAMSLMAICGMYNRTGEFLASVGIPAKSGVSGVVMAVVPGKYGICVYSPVLDEFGNSYRGVKFLEILSKKLNLSIFKG